MNIGILRVAGVGVEGEGGGQEVAYFYQAGPVLIGNVAARKLSAPP